MSKICDVCGKKPVAGNTVSHSHKKTRRWWKPNIQKVKVLINGEIKSIRVCSNCLKSGRVKRA